MVDRVVGRVVGRMVVVVIAMALRGKRRAGKHHQQQGGGKNLFHGKNVAQERRQRKGIELPASRKERVRRGRAPTRKPA
jgi:hypothetical protein